MAQFDKLDPTDPDPDQIPPEIIEWAKTIAFLKGPITLYLHGDLTYRKALEVALLAVTREYRNLMSRIIKKQVKQRMDHSDLLPMLPPQSNPLALPSSEKNKEENAPEIETAESYGDYPAFERDLG